MKKTNLKKLEKINNIRIELGYVPYTPDIIEDYVNSAPISSEDIKRSNWKNNIINKELLKEIYGFESPGTAPMVSQILYKNGNRINYPMTEDKIVNLLFWYYCIGYCDHRITIERSGSMKVIHSYHVFVGFHQIESFSDYKLRVFSEIESKLGR